MYVLSESIKSGWLFQPFYLVDQKILRIRNTTKHYLKILRDSPFNTAWRCNDRRGGETEPIIPLQHIRIEHGEADD
jgi:hypothetical protein